MGLFGQPKQAASLSSGLLARKGQARPAMRPQGFAGLSPNTSLDDLGWNDMGSDVPSVPVAVRQPVPMTPAVEPVATAPVPPVLVEREALKDEIETTAPLPDAGMGAEASAEPSEPVQALAHPPVVRPVSLATAARIGRETTRKGKAAFTLRLDNDRHLRLRLASALSNRSAQGLVTEALDAFLQSWPEVEALASQVPPAKKPAR